MIDDFANHNSSTQNNSVSPAELAALTHPQDVLDHKRLSHDEKRALLAEWASDIHAVMDAPALRQLDNGAQIDVDEILSALKALDGMEVKSRHLPLSKTGDRISYPRRRRPARGQNWTRRFLRDDDDDDPTPPAAASAWPEWLGFAEDGRAAA